MQTCSKIWLSSVVLISSESVSNEGKSLVRSGLNKLRLWPLRKFKLSIHTNHWSPVCHCWTNCTTSIPLDVFNNAASHDVILFPISKVYLCSQHKVSVHSLLMSAMTRKLPVLAWKLKNHRKNQLRCSVKSPQV